MKKVQKKLPTGVSHVWRKSKVCRVHRVPDDCRDTIWVDDRDANGDRIPTGRYQVTVQVVRDGRRRQLGHTHDTITSARKEAEHLRSLRDQGKHSHLPTRKTFRQVADEWLEAKTCRAGTIADYRAGMKKANAAFGDKLVHEVTRHDIERLRASEAARGMSVTTVGALLRDVRAVLQRAVQTDLVHRNVAADVEPAGAPAKRRAYLSVEGFEAIRAHLVGHRNEFAWVMSLYGARRSEVLGLRWSDLDLDAETVTIARSRVPAPEKRTNRRDPRTVVGDTKTERGHRTLPLWAPMLAAARRTRTLRQQEHLALGIPWDEEAYICVTEDDRREPLAPMLPDRYSRLWGKLCDAAGVSRVPLHSARHGSVTRMRAAGMLDYEVAAWHGHDESIMRLVYTHTSTTTLRAADPEARTSALRAAGEGL